MILVVMVVFKNTVSRAFLNFRWEGDRKFPQWLDRRMRTCYGRTKKRRRGGEDKNLNTEEDVPDEDIVGVLVLGREKLFIVVYFSFLSFCCCPKSLWLK